MTTQQNQKTYYVYKHTFENGTCYIGKGTDKRAYRFYNRGKMWTDTSKKYGNPIVEILYDLLSEENAFNIEIETIKKHKEDGIKLLNITDGGDGVSGYRFSDKQKQEQSERLTAIYENQEIRIMISECVKKSFQDEGVKQRHRDGNIKAWDNEERRINASNINKKRYEDPNEKLKTSNANKKRFEDPTQREIQSINNKKRYEDPNERIRTAEATKKALNTPEAKKKMSDSQKRAWVERKKRIALQGAIITDTK